MAATASTESVAIAKQLLVTTTAEHRLMRMKKMTISTSLSLRELKTPVRNANAVN